MKGAAGGPHYQLQGSELQLLAFLLGLWESSYMVSPVTPGAGKPDELLSGASG